MIVISATGSIHDGLAVTKARSEIVALNDGKTKRLPDSGHLPGQPAANLLEYGLLAGVGTALGLVLPPRRRVPA